MTYLVNDKCIKCKHTTCVDVCPVDCFYEVKNKSIEEKKIVIEALWTIIYSDEKADMYETNLMRRLSGLLYLDAKSVGDIKEKVKLNQ